ncbi:Beta-amylase 8 [Turnera subulata]|uniref:Beta-amylase n=1 Tax=Turnera subulata TaxID=218843 RepID=A0A9Q0FDL8_9ROSI|nr:Beta-amylase 8 [Turnera subulata]
MTTTPTTANNINNPELLIPPQSDPYSQPQPHPVQPNPHPVQPQPRRPRGFAATAAAAAAITSRMLAGLRQYGNFPLPARADMNDVLAALAREAGWTVEADGTTYRQSPVPPPQLAFKQQQQPPPPPPPPPPACSSGLRIDDSLSPASLDSVVITERDHSRIDSVGCLDTSQLIQDDVGSGDLQENDFTGTPYIPVYVALANGFINTCCQLVDPQGLRQELSHIKAMGADGLVVDCWWGIVEAWSPQKYLWSGYRELFNIVREFKLKLQVVLAFHECGGNDASDVLIPLPQWVLEIGRENQDIFFTDREGRRNTETLSWGIDKERVLRGRTGIEVYFDFMRSFRTEFDDLFAEGLISAIEIGLGASGELKFPSFPERMGWRYPGIGEFQCYDKYLQQNLCKTAKLRGHSFWARGPDNAGQYNSRPHETGFFCERGDYDSYFGRFFLHWYSQLLIDHADNVLSLANLAFEDTRIVVKIPAVYWWYKTASHAAELTAGYYNPTNQDGYSSVFEVLKKHSVTIKFQCSGLPFSGHENDEAFADPEGLNWQVLNSAWDRGLMVAGMNVLSCYDREGYMRVAEMAKPRNDPDHHHFSFFVYQQPSPLLQGMLCFPELDYFIKCMHGELSAEC